MPLSHASLNALLHLLDYSSLWRLLWKQCVMNVCRLIPSRPPNHNALAFLLPLQDRSWADAKTSTHLNGNRNLPLRGDPGMSECHA